MSGQLACLLQHLQELVALLLPLQALRHSLQAGGHVARRGGRKDKPSPGSFANCDQPAAKGNGGLWRDAGTSQQAAEKRAHLYLSLSLRLHRGPGDS